MASEDARDEAGGTDAVPAPSQVSARIEDLIERGLEKYGEGDLLGALCEWEHALALEPLAKRASEYIEYVRDNFDLLDEQFKAAKDIATRAVASGVPVPDVPEEVSGAYDLVELGFVRDAPTPVGPRPPPPPPKRVRSTAVDEGWELDDLAAPLPPPPDATPPPPASTLDEDLAGVSQGLDQLGSEVSVDDDSELILTSADEVPPPSSEEEEITVPGGEEPPPLPERPALSREARHYLESSLGGRPPVVTIAPRDGTNPGTHAGTNPGELPAPPQVATPSELVLELGALDSNVPDDRALAEPANEAGQPVSEAELGLSDDDTGEATSPASHRRAMRLLADDDFGARTSERVGFLDLRAEEMPTIDRGSIGLRRQGEDDDDFAEIELRVGGEEFADDPGTGERTASRSPFPTDSVTGATGGERAAGAAGGAGETIQGIGPSVLVDEDLLRPSPPGPDTPDTATTQALPRPPLDEEAVRRRVNDLLRLAREAAERGDHVAAVEAAEMAASEDPQGAVAPVVLHRHRDLLYRVYEGHIGEMTQVPLVAVPLHAVAAEHLDHKTGFLLSRIDGMLSFEDILDIAGMPRLDAYRILSLLLRKGIIEVR